MRPLVQVGLLQPIGVTPDNTLVFGERRLRAARDILGWHEIPARVVNVEAIILGEFHENEMRKEFTVSERVAIGKKIEELLGNRQGQRTDKELPQNFAEVEPGKETRVIAAEKAGFGNAETYRQAKKVVDEGTSALVGAMDAGEVAVSTAAEIATLPAEEQEEIIAKGEGEILRKAKDIKRERARLRIVAREEQKTQALTKDHPLAGQRYKLIHGDLLQSSGEITSGSVDAIVTDPPYPAEFLSEFQKLWTVADRVLRPGGHCLVMAGQSHLPLVLSPFAAGTIGDLTYQWTLGYFTPGQSAQIFGRKVKSNWKPVLWIVKGQNEWEHVEDTVRSDTNDKRFHEWGQSVGGMAQLIERFTVRNSIILDPFCGGGATGVAALSLGRFFIGIDRDGACIQQTAERLLPFTEAEETPTTAAVYRLAKQAGAGCAGSVTG